MTLDLGGVLAGKRARRDERKSDDFIELVAGGIVGMADHDATIFEPLDAEDRASDRDRGCSNRFR